MNKRNETLDELLRGFMDDRHIRDIKADLDFADRVFAAHPVPAVRQETLASIEAKIHGTLIQRRVLKAGTWIAAAAAILIIAVLSRDPLVNTPPRTAPASATNYNPENIWKKIDFYAMNLQVDSIEQDLSDLSGSLGVVRLKMYDTTDSFSLDMMELDELEYLAENASLGKGSFYAQ